MHLHVIICFVLVVWLADGRPFEPPVRSAGGTWAAVWGQIPAFWLAATLASRSAVRHLKQGRAGSLRAQTHYHRSVTILRGFAVLGFAAAALVTDWADRAHAVAEVSWLPGLADLVVLLPFLLSAAVIFGGLYGIDRALHEVILESRSPGEGEPVWSLGQYLNFNLRHHLLVVVVPLILILASFELARRFEDRLNAWFQVNWAAEVTPGVVAGAVFVVAPLMLRHLWPTHRLPDGPLRRHLEGLCQRIGLRYRDILVWRSGGMMINAAVMGLFGRVRYILLSDGLLETMSTAQVEAVFGHEAGHVRHRHIPFFLLFAVCSMLLLSAVVEVLRLAAEWGWLNLDLLTIQILGGTCVVVFWAVGFGWVSRRFERQADLFGARCVSPERATDCIWPCAAHDDASVEGRAGRLCATGAAIFATALDQVAVLNGIPHEENSWRHSSIGSRMRSLAAMAGDPQMTRRFGRLVRRAKIVLAITAIVGCILATVYIWDHPIYGVGVDPSVRTRKVLRLESGPPSASRSSHGRADH